jgi:hypothetical protein
MSTTPPVKLDDSTFVPFNDNYGQQASDLQQSIGYGVQQDPDQHARLLKQQQQTGIGPEISKGHETQIQQSLDANTLNPGQMVASHPRTAAWATNPDNAAVSGVTDLQLLTQIEQANNKRNPMPGLTPSQQQAVFQERARVSLQNKDQTEFGSALMNASAGIANFFLPFVDAAGVAIQGGYQTGKALLDKAAYGPSYDLGQNLKDIWSDRRTMAVTSATDKIREAYAGAVKTGPQQYLQDPSTGQTFKNPDYAWWGRGLGTALEQAPGQLAAMYATGGMLGGAGRLAGVTPEAAGVEGLVGAKGLDLGEKALPAILGTQSAQATYADALSRGADQDTAVRAAIQSGFVNWILMGKMPGAVMPESTLGAVGQWAGRSTMLGTTMAIADNAIAKQYDPQRSLFEGIPQSILTMAAFEGVGTISHITDLAEQSKLRQRSPEKFHEALENIFSGESSLRIPAEEFVTYFQSKGIDPAEAAGKLGIQNFDEARLADSPLEISKENYFANLEPEHQRGLLQDVMLPGLNVTSRQIEAGKESLEQWEAGGGMERMRQATADVDAETKASDEYKQVQEHFRQQYIAQGNTPAVAEDYATTAANVYANLARESGLKPTELLAQNPMMVAAGGEAPSIGVAGEPPVAEGMTRLYHGEVAGETEGKAWFSTNRQYARDYRRDSQLQYVDVPTNKLADRLDWDEATQGPFGAATHNIELDSSETGPRKAVPSVIPEGAPLYQTLPSRWPTAAGLTPSVHEPMLADLPSLRKNPEQLENAVSAIQEEPGMKNRAQSVKGRLEAQIKRMQANLEWLHDLVPEAIRERAKKWYDGARKISDDWSQKYGKTRAQTAGVMAVLSPQKDWFMNVSLGERVMDILSTQMDHKFDDRMKAAAFRFLIADFGKAEGKRINTQAYDALKDKSLAEVARGGDLRQVGIWIRAYDEAYHSSSHTVIHPEGDFGELVKTAKGEEGKRAWGGFDAIGKAASIFLDGSPENINLRLGGEHKVRNFYNNIYAPEDPRFTTIDTHAVAAALLRPLAGNDKAVADNFGASGGTNLTGVSGTYPIYYEAYRRAAEAKGILPREMQSITWEAVRGLFTEGFKTEANKEAIDAIWRQVDEGKLSVDEARQQILEKAGGIEHPAWWQEGKEPEPNNQLPVRDKTYLQERPPFSGTKLTFEVAPDPNNAALTARWNALPAETRLTISRELGWQAAGKTLAHFKPPKGEPPKGELHMQMGGYLDNTNPSLSLWMDPGTSMTKLMDVARVLGYALDQDSMMVTSPKKFKDGSEFGTIVIRDVDANEAAALYTDIRSHIRAEDGSTLINGHTTADGRMAILVGAEEAEALARRVAEHLGDAHDVGIDSLNAAWPEKGEDGYGLRRKGEPGEGSSESPLRAFADQLRSETSDQLERQVQNAEQGRTFHQSTPGDQPRGWMTIRPDGSFEIGRTKIGDLSTMIHEPAHVYLELMSRLVQREGASDILKSDWAKILDFLGAKEGEPLTREQHELWARANEAYVREGKAPSKDLKGVFQRFAVWLTSLYPRAESLGVELTPEMRGVLDRLYASEQGVNREAEKQGPQTFTSAEEAGMTEEQFKNYAKLHGLSVENAKSEILARLNEDAAREQAGAWKEEANNVRRATAERLDASPQYTAIRSLRKGELEDGTKINLSRDELVKQFGEDRVKALQKQHPGLYRNDGDMDAQTAAELLGFDSGQQLIEAMEQSPRRAQAIEQATRDYMTAKHGDIRYDGTLPDEIKAALENDTKATSIHTELRALRAMQSKVEKLQGKVEELKGKLAGQRALRQPVEIPPIAAFRARAKEIVDGKPISDLKPTSYLDASRKFAREAFEQMRKGNVQEAAEAKQKELLNHFLFREATEAQKSVTKFEAFVKKATTRAMQSKIGKAGGDYLAQFNNLLQRYGLAPGSPQGTGLAQWAQSLLDMGKEPAIDPRLLDETRAMNYRDASVSEIRAVHDALLNIRKLAYQELGMVVHGRKVEFDNAISAMDARARESLGSSPRPVLKENITRGMAAGDLAGRGAALLARMEFVMRRLDGGTTGPWHDFLWNLAADSQGAESTMQREITAQVGEIIARIPKEQRQRLLDKVSIDGIGEPVTRKTMISMALNMGNAGNLDRLQKTFEFHGWDPGAIDSIKSTLTREEWQFVQDTWNVLQGLGTKAFEFERRMTGIPPVKVDPVPFSVKLADGSDMHLDGGYFTIAMDPDYSVRGAQQDAGTAAQNLMESGYTRATTSRGYTKERQGFGGPLLFDYEQVLTQHTAKVIKDITHREFMLTANKITLDPTIRRTLMETLGPAYERQMLPWLKTIINDRNGSSVQGLSDISKGMNMLRTNVVKAALGLKFSTTLLQLTHASSIFLHTSPGSYAQAMIDFLAHPLDMTEEIKGLSPNEMATRGDNLDRDMRAVLRDATESKSIGGIWARIGMAPVQFMDHLLSFPMWLSVYRDALKENVNLPESEAQYLAQHKADGAVRMGLGANAPKDLPPIMRNHDLTKFLTTMGGFHNLKWNQMADVASQFSGDRKYLKMTYGMVMAGIIPAVLGSWISGRGPEEGENPGAWAAKRALLFPLETMAILNIAVDAIDNRGDVRLSPIVSSVERAAKAAHTALGDNPEKDRVGLGMDFLQATMELFGVSGTDQAFKTARYLRKVNQGKISNPNPVEAIIGARH